MKLGVFDSGLGGLLIAKSIREHMPDIDMMYFGDTLHLPYGNRSLDAIYAYSCRAVDFLFAEGCNLIVVACNTVSASALRKMQQVYLPNNYPERRILGVVVPTLECAIDRGYKKIGLIGTNYTVKSNVYADELQKIDSSISIYQAAAPLLVPLVENDGMPWVDSVLEHYLRPILMQNIEGLILGCTHYVFLKDNISSIVGGGISLLSQDEIIPEKLADYLRRHPEISAPIERNGKSEFFVSDITQGYKNAAYKMYGHEIDLQLADLCIKTNAYRR